MATQFFKIFRAGKHTAMSGDSVVFSESQLKDTAAYYTQQTQAAPLVIGHPETNGPSLGTVLDLHVKDATLFANAEVSDLLTGMVRNGSYKYVSASFSQSNIPGVWGLRHVGLLGAHPPAVKGLGALSFAESAHFCEAIQTAFVELSGFGAQVSFSEMNAGATAFQMARQSMHQAINQMIRQYPEYTYLEAARLLESMILAKGGPRIAAA